MRSRRVDGVRGPFLFPAGGGPGDPRIALDGAVAYGARAATSAFRVDAT